MRHLDLGPAPKLVTSAEFRWLLDELAAFHRGGGARTKQVRGAYEIVERIRQHVAKQLDTIIDRFDGLCAYTEQPVTRPALVTHRPGADAQDVDGRVWPDHYWWLLGEWENWNLVEAEVGRRKGSLFPTLGERASPPTAEDAPGVDDGLLLDPRTDHPQWWLRAMPDGRYEPRDHPDPQGPVSGPPPRPTSDVTGRGELTIRSLGLNEPRLVERRAATHERLESALDPASGRTPSPFQGFVDQRAAQLVLETANGRGGGRRDRGAEEVLHLAPYVVPLLVEQPQLAPALRLGPRHVDALLAVADDIGAGQSGLARLREAFGREPEMRPRSGRGAPTSAPPAAPAEAHEGHLWLDEEVLRDEYITRIEIRDFRCLDHVVLDLSDSPVDPPRSAEEWAGPERRRRARPRAATTVYVGSRTADTSTNVVPSAALLGENGSGKSSVLQAIALCLAGDDARRTLDAADLRLGDLVRREGDRAEVTITFSRGQTAHISFERDDSEPVVRQPAASQLLVRALGASRAAARGTSSVAERRTVDVANLFDPATPALDVDAWAADLRRQDTEAFNVAAATLKYVLGLQAEDHRLDVVEGELAVDGQPLRLLSDGYRALISLVCAVMAGTDLTYSESDAIRGVVLVDEIGAHLHPRWRMDVTGRLREVFPQVQLLLTTHEPLCLRGMREREVVRVVRPAPGRPPVLETVARSPSEFRVDQLLTSEFFGLSTTIDPQLQRLWDTYHALAVRLVETDDPDPGLARRAAEAREQALAREREIEADQQVLGTTRRAQLAYEVIDEYLAHEPALPADERAARRRDAVQRATRLYRPTFPSGEGTT